jgi:hypothetical protein
MNLEFEHNNWFLFLSNLGSRISSRSKTKTWMDLENFIVLGTKYAIEDARLFNSFVIICIHLAPILSPFKIKKIANKLIKDEEFNILGFIISTIQENVRNKTQWNSLISMCDKKKCNNKLVLLFNTKSFKIGNDFKRWNINASKLELGNHDKYVHIEKLLQHDLIKQRFLGVKTVYSDINFYRQFYIESSLNKMAKDTFHDYNTIYQANELIGLVA